MTALPRAFLACLCLAAAGCNDSQQAEALQQSEGAAAPAQSALPAVGAAEPVYAFATGKSGLSLLKAGWHEAEADHVWSKDASAHIAIPAGGNGFKKAELTFGIYRPSAASEKLVRFLMNGAQVAEYKAAANTPTQSTDSVSVTFDLPAQPADLTVEVQTPESPKDHGSPDTRVLGIAAQQLILK